MGILVVTTGGTIDKIYFDQKSTFQVGDPQIVDVLREANITIDYRVISLMKKDSLEITEEDRKVMLKTIQSQPEKQIVMTHGTDTMVDTAKHLMSITDKTIVLTGAMQPAKFRLTDAVFNIASAVTAVQVLPDGIYLAMNGKIFNPANTRKNVAKNRFENF